MDYSEEDQPHRYSHFYLVPQKCKHVCEIRVAEAVPQKTFRELLDTKCAWCEAEEDGDEVPAEIHNPRWHGGALVRLSPFSLKELQELDDMEAGALRDAPPPTE